MKTRPISLSALAFLLATAAVAVPLGGASTPATALTFTPIADAYVTSQKPYTNYGASTKLRVASSPVQRTYLRFRVEGLAAPVVRATLRLYVSASVGGSDGVFAVRDNAWSERGITYVNGPALDPTPIGMADAVAAGTWTTVDVSSLVTGNGTYSLAVKQASTGSANFLSRESRAYAPRLVVETESGAVPPNVVSPPNIAGRAEEGQTLTANQGTWSGTAPITYAHQWQRCDQSGGSCADISGAVGPSHTLAAADVGSTMRVSVAATNSAGSGVTFSNSTPVIAAAPPSLVPPRNASPPTIAGPAQEGQTLNADPGSWSGTAPIGYAYQWRRCGLGYSDAVRADSPVVYWRLGEEAGSTAADVSGNGRNGVYGGGTAPGDAGALPRSKDSAARLDGNDDRVVFGSFAGFPATALSLELWLKTADATKAGTAFSYASTASDNDLQVRDARNFVVYRGASKVATGVSANDGAWHHIVVTWRGSDGQLQLFKDGQLAFATTLASATSLAGGGTVVLGQDQDTIGGTFDPAQAFLGHMDEVAVYPVVLSPARVQAHYAGATDGTCVDVRGETGQSYGPRRADVGGTIQVAVTGSNAGGAATTTSAETALVTTAPSLSPAPAPALNPLPPPPPPPPPPSPVPPSSGSPQTSLLTWAPPVLVNPTTIAISSPTRELYLDPARDYVLKMPSTPVRPGPSGGFWISGGHNIVLIGGEIDFSGVVNTSPTEIEGRLMTFSGVTGTIHIEGLYAHGDGLVEGIQTFSSKPAVLQLENCRFERLHTTAKALHSDLLQWDGGTDLRVDRFTGASEYQGFFRTNDVGSATFRRVNLKGVSGSTDNSPRLLWQASAFLPMTLDEFYIEPRPGQALGIAVWPGKDYSDSTLRPITQADGSLVWPARTGIGGAAIPGPPPGGDFVPVGMAGAGYVSSGYR